MSEYNNIRAEESKNSDYELDDESEDFPRDIMDESKMIGSGPLPFTEIYAGKAHCLEAIRHERRRE